MRPTLIPGLRHVFHYDVPENRTVPHLLPEADHFASMPPVLATGYLIGLVEWTCMQLLEPHLEASERTLGVHVDLSHEAPTRPGDTLAIGVQLNAVQRRKLSFSVDVTDNRGRVCRGTHDRAAVDLARFQEALDDNGS